MRRLGGMAGWRAFGLACAGGALGYGLALWLGHDVLFPRSGPLVFWGSLWAILAGFLAGAWLAPSRAGVAVGVVAGIGAALLLLTLDLLWPLPPECGEPGHFCEGVGLDRLAVPGVGVFALAGSILGGVLGGLAKLVRSRA